MPDLPTPGDGWTTWIIATIMTALASAIGTVIAMAKLIESNYKKQIEALQASFTKFESVAAQHLEESKKERELFWREVKECQEDRIKLSSRLSVLETLQGLHPRNNETK